jgi:choice-of-anchor B domain-containing protein
MTNPMLARRLGALLALLPSVVLAQDARPALFDVRCEGGMAASYPCNNVHLLAYLPFQSLGGGLERANDVWGYSVDGRDFVLLGRGDGTYFVEITNPTAPLYLGKLPSHAILRSLWRDIKVYRGHAYVVSEAFRHGMQVFDLSALLSVGAPPVDFQETGHYAEQGLGSAHNIAINEDSGFAYVVGSTTCSGGLHMVDLSRPKEPRFAGCFSADSYTHDVQCVSYRGPDRDYRNREICFASNEDTVTIVDVTDKSNPRQISRTSYPGVGYTHQGWLTEDQLYFLVGDELDEQYFAHNTMTRVFDVADLDLPVLSGAQVADTAAIDHNLYVRGNLVYQANYRAGLRILHLDRVAEAHFPTVGVFDIYPSDDAPEFNGAWSVYPFFPNGVVAVSGIEQGLFILQPDIP